MAELTPEACRAARGLLKWGVRELAAESGLSVETIVLYEGGRPARETTRTAIVKAFAAYGVEITNGTGTGAKLLNDRPVPKARAKAKTRKK